MDFRLDRGPGGAARRHPRVLRRRASRSSSCARSTKRALRPRAVARARRDGRLRRCACRRRRAASGSAWPTRCSCSPSSGRRLVPGPARVDAPRRGAGSAAPRAATSWSAALDRCAPSAEPVLVEHLDALDALLVLQRRRRLRASIRAALRARARSATPLDPLTPRAPRRASCRAGERIGGADDARARCALEGAALVAGAAARHRRGDAGARRRLREAARAVRPRDRLASRRSSTSWPTCFVRQEVARAAVYAAGATLDQPEVGSAARAPSRPRRSSPATPR